MKNQLKISEDNEEMTVIGFHNIHDIAHFSLYGDRVVVSAHMHSNSPNHYRVFLKDGKIKDKIILAILSNRGYSGTINFIGCGEAYYESRERE